MKFDLYRFGLLILIGMSLIVTACTPEGGDEIPAITEAPEIAVEDQQVTATCSNPIEDPSAESLATNNSDSFAWSLFLYLNCPAQSNQPSPLIWETWKPNYAVYLAGGQKPSGWGSPLPPRMLSAAPEISGKSLTDNAGQPVLYEIRMNAAAFNYILGRELYSKDGQLKFFNAPATDPVGVPVVFPQDAIEIKAAWLILSLDDPRASRYYTIPYEFVDEDGKTQSVLAGLSGFHITSKILPNWVWATFEQVDNQVMTPAPQTLPTSPSVQKLNDQIHSGLPADSPWKYYDLRGTQTAFTDANNEPTLLANTLIETDFQNSSSCITCHGLASRGAAAQGRLEFFNTTNGVQGYIGKFDDPGNIYYDKSSPRVQVCFNAQLSAFSPCDEPTQVVYKLMDFVWSLREAR